MGARGPLASKGTVITPVKPLKIHLVAAALPPALDGIGDYSARLAAELAQIASVKVLTAQPDPAAIPGVTVETVFSVQNPRSVWNLARQIEADPPDWVLLQYNPFSYGKWGLNLPLPLAMRRIKRRCPATKIAVMVHETFVPFGVNWKFRVMTLWQRPQFAVLSRTADVLFFSVDAWAQTFWEEVSRQARPSSARRLQYPACADHPR